MGKSDKMHIRTRVKPIKLCAQLMKFTSIKKYKGKSRKLLNFYKGIKDCAL